MLILCLCTTAWAEDNEGSDDPQPEPAEPEDRLDYNRTLRDRMTLMFGYHLFYYTGSLRETGRQPDGVLPITPGEIRYTVRDKFDLSQYHGPVVEFEWEHLIIPQFGLCWGGGLFLGGKQLDVTVEDARFEGPYSTSGLYFTLIAPRGHLRLGQRVDLSGGIDVALLIFSASYVVDVTIGDEKFQFDEQIYQSTPLYSAVLALELRLSRHWGLIFVDKFSYGKVEAREGNLIVGGNSTFISGAIHF